MWAGGAALTQPLPGPSRPRAHAAVAVGGAIVGQPGAGRRGGDDGGAEGLRGSARGVQAHLPHLQKSPRVPPARSQRSRFAPTKLPFPPPPAIAPTEPCRSWYVACRRGPSPARGSGCSKDTASSSTFLREMVGNVFSLLDFYSELHLDGK